MKKTLITLLASAALALGVQANIITQWDFNSAEFDFDPESGSLEPSIGTGEPAEAVGGVNQRFGSVAGGATSDPNTGDNSQWRIGTIDAVGPMPAQGTGNKTAGVQFMAGTEGFQNIRFQWDHYNSATGSRYWRIQYTLDGTDWVDHEVYVNPAQTTWHNERSVSFNAVPGANNNPNFGVRLVAEFESTATGSGTEGYVGTQASGGYGVNGTLWLDMATFLGDVYDPSVVQPTVSSIEDQVTMVNTPIDPLEFTIGHPTTPPDQLELTAEISNFEVVWWVDFGGSGSSRTATLNLAPDTVGDSFITIRVTDPNSGGYIEERFMVTILEPSISAISDQATEQNVPVMVSFTIANLPGDPSSWTVAGSSSYPAAVPDANIVFEGSGAERTATITPAADAFGDTVITITAEGNGVEAVGTFNLRVRAPIVVHFDVHDIPNQPVPSAPPTTEAVGVMASDITRGPGLRAAGLTRGFSANRWSWDPAPDEVDPALHKWEPGRENAVLMGEYYEFSITIEEGYIAALTTLNASYRRSALAAPEFLEWQYSLDGFATPGITIVPTGSIWDALGWTETYFKYMGRTSGSSPASVNPYDWMIMDVAGRPNTIDSPGDPMPTIHLTDISELQNLAEGNTVTFRLYAWTDRADTLATSTFALGRVDGPTVGGRVMLDPTVTRPTLSEIEDQVTLVNTPIAPIPLTIGHSQFPPADLVLSVEDISNPDLIASVEFEGSGANWSLVIILVSDASGQATITIRVTDPNGNWAEEMFDVIIPTPAIPDIADEETAPNTPLNFTVEIENLPGDPASWIITGASSNPGVVADENIVISGTGTERTITISPVPNQVDDVVITITAESNGAVAAASFNLRVRPPLVAGFDFTGVPNQALESVSPTTVAAGVVASPVTRGPGINATGLTHGFSANGWNREPEDRTRENALATGAYFQFSLTIEDGYTASLATLNATYRRSAGSAPRNLEWQYSLDGFATPGVTIVPQGPTWEVLEWTESYFQYMGRTGGTARDFVAPYEWMIQDVPGRPNDLAAPEPPIGDPMPMIDLRGIAELQSLPEGTTVTFRLYAWADEGIAPSGTNTLGLGRYHGPEIGGIVMPADAPVRPSLTAVFDGDNVRISWPATAEGYVLVGTSDLAAPDWQPVFGMPEEIDGEFVFTLSSPTGSGFFQLRK